MSNYFNEQKYKLVVWSFALVFLLNALAPFVFLLKSSEANLTSDSQIVICTPYGYEYISLDDSEGEYPDNKKNSNCPVCLFALHQKHKFVFYENFKFQAEYNEVSYSFFEKNISNFAFNLTKSYYQRAPPSSLI